ncbi:MULTISPECIES: hypothetical protein [unclassified Streptomyces]|uniref:hypothetical protein n=1 Tax=unclassified Streptomyces TaxID=2593676 RepID=UPI002481E5D2|nr:MULTISPECIES: hypothetical protein [unclassified Streptomyces]MDA5284586.1 hypothetical protein [Streptomyces sp. Isolate_45]MDX2390821.1 hypothetical protein [Streptomyces sp. DK15]
MRLEASLWPHLVTHAMGGIVPMGESRASGMAGSAGTLLPTTSTELSVLLTAVRRGRVLTVTGRFREPRSLLVRDIALRLASNFCDGAAVIAVRHDGSVRELVDALGCLPGMPFLPCGTANAASWLAERDMLLVLDDCDRLAPRTLEWLRALLTVAPGLRVLAAGRYPLAVGQGRVHRL